MTRTQNATQRTQQRNTTTQATPTQGLQETTNTEEGFAPELDLASSNKVTPGNILSLQRAFGNQAVQRMIQRQRADTGPATGTIQRAGEGTAVAARPGVGAYALGKAPRVNRPLPPVPDSPPAAPVSPLQAEVQAGLAAQTASDKAKFDAAYDNLTGVRGEFAIIDGIVDFSMQDKVIPELSKSVLVKTRKDLTSDIKSDTALFRQLGPTDEAREAALAKIMQDVVTSVVGTLPSMEHVLNAIRKELITKGRALPPPDMDQNTLMQIGSLRQAKAWQLALSKVEALDTAKRTYYSTQIASATQSYIESNGDALVDRMDSYLSKRRTVKAELRAAFNKGVDQRLGEVPAPPPLEDVPPPPPPGLAPTSDADVPPPPPFSESAEEAPPPPPPGLAPTDDIPPPPPYEGGSASNSGGLAYATEDVSKPKYRKNNHNADTGQDYTEYATTGSGVASAAGGVSTKFAQLVSPVVSSATAAADTVSGFGAAGGLLGVASGALETARGIQDITNSGSSTGDRAVLGGGRTASGVASMVQQGGSAAYNIASLTSGTTSAAALTGAAVAGGGGVAMGAVDMVRGSYGAYKGHQRQRNLNNLAAQDGVSSQVRSAATQAASTQEMRKKVSGATVLKGGLLVAGGVTLLLLATNPVGWILMGAAAVVGGLAALWRFWQKRKRKKAVAIRELGLEEPFKDYEKRKADATKGWSPSKYKERQAALATVKASNPLHAKMESMGYGKNAYDKFYADYIHDTAQVLHAHGVLNMGDNAVLNGQMKQVIENMGLTVNAPAKTPTAEQIGKALNT